MMPKVKAPKPPKMPISALDTKRIMPDDSVSAAYNSLISTSATGLERKAEVKKKTLLGGV